MSDKAKVAAIVAMSENRVIGINNSLPWYLPEDLKRFKKLTTGCPVIMGRKTFESLPTKFRPLPDRRNIVISSNSKMESLGVEVFSDPLDAVRVCQSDFKGMKPPIWIIGGSQLYSATTSLWDEIYLTLIKKQVEGDAFFPIFEDAFDLIEEMPGEGFSFLKYMRKQEH